MKPHYKTAAEWMADFNAMMRERETSSTDATRASHVITHSKPIAIAPTNGLATTKPIPIRKVSS